MPAKDILKAALAAVGEKLVDKAKNTNHQYEMHQETYLPTSFSVTSTLASRCQKEANRRLKIETVNFSVKREKSV
jgi:hypothetical protein